MAGAALAARLPAAAIETAGTLTIEGQPMSWRTRSALESVGLHAPSHRSRQATAADLARADLIVGLAPEHVEWVRREHPVAAGRTGTLKRLCRSPAPIVGPPQTWVAGLHLERVSLEEWETVVDPGGGDEAAFVACAHEVVELVDELALLLGATPGSAAEPDRRGTVELPDAEPELLDDERFA
jgi:protein-tyrosine-phosphatase